MLITRAPWTGRTDPGPVMCAVCPKRLPASIHGPSTCTDPACFARKVLLAHRGSLPGRARSYLVGVALGMVIALGVIATAYFTFRVVTTWATGPVGSVANGAMRWHP